MRISGKRFKGREWRIWLIVAVAIVLRVWSLNSYVEGRPKRALGALPFLFEPGNIAFSIASGHGFASPFRVDTGPTAWMTPVYPGILAGIFHVFGPYTYDSFLAAALLNIAFSAFTCVPLYFIGKRIGRGSEKLLPSRDREGAVDGNPDNAPGGTGLAVITAGLWAIFPNAILLPYQSLWDQSLAALLCATLLWASVARRAWWEQGLLWGAALMTTPTLAAALPFLLGWQIWTGLRTKNAALVAAMALACCIPWTIRNYAVFHILVPLRTVMGLSMWLGNNPKADGVTTSNLHPISNSAERALYVQQGEIEYNNRKQHEALVFMRDHPGHALQLMGRRFVAIWAGGSQHPIDDFVRNHDLWFRWVLAFNIVGGIAAAIGIVLLFHAHNIYAFPAMVFPVFFPIAYYLTLAPPRYRHPTDPAVMLLAAVTLRAIWQTGSTYVNSVRPK